MTHSRRNDAGESLPALLDNHTTSAVVFQRLQRDIIMGKLKPGTKLNERELTAKYGISRTPLREALRELVRSQLAVSISYRGVFVREIHFDFARDVYELRAGLEGFAASLAATRIDAKALDVLATLVNRIEELSTDVGSDVVPQENRDEIMLLNSRFHRTIAEVAGNAILLSKLDELWVAVNLVRNSVWRTNARTESSYLEHQEILAALRDRNPETVRELCERHVHQAWRYVRLHLIDEPA